MMFVLSQELIGTVCAFFHHHSRYKTLTDGDFLYNNLRWETRCEVGDKAVRDDLSN